MSRRREPARLKGKGSHQQQAKQEEDAAAHIPNQQLRLWQTASLLTSRLLAQVPRAKRPEPASGAYPVFTGPPARAASTSSSEALAQQSEQAYGARPASTPPPSTCAAAASPAGLSNPVEGTQPEGEVASSSTTKRGSYLRNTGVVVRRYAAARNRTARAVDLPLEGDFGPSRGLSPPNLCTGDAPIIIWQTASPIG